MDARRQNDTVTVDTIRRLWRFILALSLSLTARDSLAEPGIASEMLVTEPSLLRLLEENGGSFQAQLTGLDYASLVHTLTEDIRAEREKFDRSAELSRRERAFFEERWLTSPETKFVLVGVVNRFDRLLVRPETCGELRLIYRLRYATSRDGVLVESFLPMSINLIYPVPREVNDRECYDVARKALKSVYAPVLNFETRFSTLEVNLHISHAHASDGPELIDQGMYLLRAFHRGPREELTPQLLENTPDVSRLATDAALRERLSRWIRNTDNLRNIDRGSYQLPDEYLATSVVSTSPFGLSRKQNLLFSQLFSASDFSDLRLAKYSHIRSPQALLRRLDSFTCSGCHQSRSVAGFHLLGLEPQPKDFNAVALPISPHLAGVLGWRRDFMQARLARKNNSISIMPPERGDGDGVGAHCGLGDVGFSRWTCALGLRCRGEFPSVSHSAVGQCLPEVLGRATSPCESAHLESFNESLFDRLSPLKRINCRDGICLPFVPNEFPNGLCAILCNERTDSGMACLSLPDFEPFKECRARGVNFQSCAQSSPAKVHALQRCDASSPCPDDYVCAATGNSGDTSIELASGACVPSYLLIQLGLGHHPREL